MDHAAGIGSNRKATKITAERRHRIARPLKLPYERDESPERDAVRQDVMRQAARDIAAGRLDTDNYSRAAATADDAIAKKRRLP